MAIELKDNTRVTYDYDLLKVKANGEAKLRVTTYNSDGDIIDNGVWLDMPFTPEQLSSLNSAVNSILSELETQYGITRVV